MSRYIKADSFDERVRKSVGLVEEELTDDFKDGVRCTLELLKTEPTADVPQWTPCSERLPEEREWIGTERFGTTISDEVYVTFENPDGVRFAEHMCFQNGKLSNYDQRTIDAFHTGAVPIAWTPLPEPWKGEADGKDNTN